MARCVTVSATASCSKNEEMQMAVTKQLKYGIRSIRSTWISLALACFLVSVCGCHTRSKEGAANHSAASSQKQYSVRGKVISVDAKDGVISLDTEAIPGFMEAMAMAYTLQNPAVASELHPGDRITAQLNLGAQGA